MDVPVPKIRVTIGEQVLILDEETSAAIFLASALTGKTPTQIVEESIEALYNKAKSEGKLELRNDAEGISSEVPPHGE